MAPIIESTLATLSAVKRKGSAVGTRTRRQMSRSLAAYERISSIWRGLALCRPRGGFTITGRAQPRAFQLEPLIVYKVYPDGRPDELGRGVNIVGTPLTSLTKIVATGDKDSVFDGYCVDESGAVPVSADAPAMLFSEIEVAKKETSTDKPPILPPPAHDPKAPEPQGVKPTPWGQLR